MFLHMFILFLFLTHTEKNLECGFRPSSGKTTETLEVQPFGNLDAGDIFH